MNAITAIDKSIRREMGITQWSWCLNRNRSITDEVMRIKSDYFQRLDRARLRAGFAASGVALRVAV